MQSCWSKSHPFRVPDWRWRRAVTFVSSNGSSLPSSSSQSQSLRAISLEDSVQSNEGDCEIRVLNEYPRIARTEDNDEEVIRAVKFLINKHKGKPLDPNQLYAFEIYNQKSNSFVRWEVEARILVGQSDEEIANLLGLSSETISVYEKWFYNVRDRLKNKSYIFQYLIAPKLPQDGSDYVSKEAIWKMYALFEDPDILNQVIFDCSTNISKDNFWVEDFISLLFRRLSVLCRFSRLSAEAVLKEFAKIHRAIKLSESGSVTKSSLLEHLQKAVDSIQWDWGEEGNNKENDKFLVGHASTRADELLILGDKELGQNFKQYLQNINFPEKNS